MLLDRGSSSERVREAALEHQPLIVFDQFEELLTLFDEAHAAAARAALVEMILRLLREPLAVKLLFSFREDHLGRVKQLLAASRRSSTRPCASAPPSADALTTIIRGPFDRFPGHFARELEPELAQRLATALADRFGSGDVSLSEVQTVCLRLWRSPDPEALLAAKGVQGLLEDELGEALDAFAPELRHAAIALLSQMVTSAGTRNVISAKDVRQRVVAEDPDIPVSLLDEALDRLDREAKLVRRERRRDIFLYEITSEFLVPWISTRREEAQLAQQRRRDEERREKERARDRRRLMLLGSAAAAIARRRCGRRLARDPREQPPRRGEPAGAQRDVARPDDLRNAAAQEPARPLAAARVRGLSHDAAASRRAKRCWQRSSPSAVQAVVGILHGHVRLRHGRRVLARRADAGLCRRGRDDPAVGRAHP